jgi:diguanylate cyclase (GGDEF)-like protein
MLTVLLKHLNLLGKKYFNQYELKDETLLLIAPQSATFDDLGLEVEEITKTIGSSIFDFSYDNNKIVIVYKEIFEEITRDVKKIIEGKNFVFPRYYNELFIKVAFEKNNKFDFLDLITSELVEDKVSQHVLKLDECTHDALDAMETKDDTKLTEVIAETNVLKQEIQDLKKSVYEDFLTKSNNRKWMEEYYLDSTRKKFTVTGTLVFVDLNNFKFINDNFGHLAGDKVLVYIVSKLKQLGGSVVRYAGDEFLLLFDTTFDAKSIHNKLHQLREILYKKDIVTNGHNFKMSFAFGISTFNKDQDFVSVLAEADAAMYSDKSSFKQRNNL